MLTLRKLIGMPGACLVSLLALAATLAVFAAAPPQASAGGIAIGGKCGTPLRTLVPTKRGAPPVMIFRVNQALNVSQYANFADQIRRNDVFLVNTREDSSDPGEWSAIVDELSASFPCNRVISLNGISSNEDVAGYAYALADDERVWGYSIDWESMDWNAARALVPSLPPWTDAFGVTRKRIGDRLVRLAATVARTDARPVGVVPAPYPHWDYGLIARSIDAVNAKRQLVRSGFQSVQTQDSCDRAPGLAAATSRLYDQYVPPVRVVRKRKGAKVIKKRIVTPPRSSPARLGVQISFSNDPNPSANMPIKRVSVAQAASCTAQAVKGADRARAILYWAHPGSIGDLLRRPSIRRLRGAR